MTQRAKRAYVRARPWLRALACGICFGVGGLIWSLPALRRRRLRRAASYETCGAHQRVRNVVLLVVAALFLVGAGARAWEATHERILCHSRITADGQVHQEPPLDVSPPPAWDITRKVLSPL